MAHAIRHGQRGEIASCTASSRACPPCGRRGTRLSQATMLHEPSTYELPALGKPPIFGHRDGRNCRNFRLEAPMMDHCPNLSGWRAEEVLAAIENKRRNRNTDRVKIGLLIEGGALRGVVSCGYGIALSDLVNPDLISIIYGSSSGGLNAIYFATDELQIALTIYVENATDQRCTNIWKFPNVLNVDWLVDEWLFGPKRFNYARLRAAMPEVFLSLTRLDNGEPYYFDAKRANIDDLRRAMKATAYAPLMNNSSQIIQGVAYNDGAVSDAIPYDQVVASGCTHLICLLTRPSSYRKQGSRILEFFERLRLAHHTQEYRQSYFERASRYNTALDKIYLGVGHCLPALAIHPAGPDEVPANIETRSDVIRRHGDHALAVARGQLGRFLQS